MKKLNLSIFVMAIGSTALSAEPQLLKAAAPLALSGKPAHFDFMTFDPSLRRILAAHKGAGTLELIDTRENKPLPAVSVGDAQGVAVDFEKKRYFVGNDDAHTVVVVDALTMKKVSEIKVDGAVDAIAFDEKNGLLYAAQDAGDRLWVIDPSAGQVKSKIAIPGVPEVLEFNAETNRIYLNIKNKDLMVSIDPNQNKVESTWSTLPAKSPHGLALDKKRQRIYSAGGNGKLVALDMKSGRVLSEADIPQGPDQIAFDADRQVIYSACKGFIGITKTSDSGLEVGGAIPSAKGAHTLAIDSDTHDVWVSYSDESRSFVQKFSPQP